jgi:hypothetical protein
MTIGEHIRLDCDPVADHPLHWKGAVVDFRGDALDYDAAPPIKPLGRVSIWGGWG